MYTENNRVGTSVLRLYAVHLEWFFRRNRKLDTRMYRAMSREFFFIVEQNYYSWREHKLELL